MSNFWHWWVIVLTLGNIAACWWLLWWTMRPAIGEAPEGEVTGHSWDGLEEYNNPLPRWWLWLFYGTIIFALIYLVLYPGLGNFKGVLGWTSSNQWQAEVAKADKEFGPIFAQYAAVEVETLATNPEAVKVGERLYLNHCASCHGSDAEGAKGYPNLTDLDTLWGGSGATIKAVIADGRTGFMPGFAEPLGSEAAIKEVAHYVLSLSGRQHDSDKAVAGKVGFDTFCAACHTPTGTGMHALGAPNLTDDVWLYGASESSIVKGISTGYKGVMPAHTEFLGADKVHLLDAYVFSLSQK